MRRAVALGAALLSLVALTACTGAPVSVQPEVDAAVLATEDVFAEVLTVADGDVCRTVITLGSGFGGVSAVMVDDAIELLRDAAAERGCEPELRLFQSDGEPVEVSHLPQYLDVEVRDGDLVL